MIDYGHELLFGAMLEPPAPRAANVLAYAELVERSGLDLVSLTDHPYRPDQLDTMTLLTMIAARTSRVRVMANCANLPLRPPVTLARTAATLDLLSGGRFELGLAPGAQQMWDLIVADGGPRRTAGESIEALEEAVAVIRALWAAGPEVRFAGRHYHLDGVPAGPSPAHDIGIWLGAYQPRLLRSIGRIADGWIPSSPYLPPEHLAGANRVIDEAALKAGRRPEAVRRLYNIAVDYSGAGESFLQGPPSSWAEQLAALTLTEGISVFILYRADSPDTISRFAAEVAPAVRELVAAERGGSA